MARNRRSKSSDRWLNEHANDPYVQRAINDGYRSRAVYKLIELDERENLITPQSMVLELGAAPGGWTQYVVERLGPQGRVVASDILPMDAVGNVTFIQGDFTDNDVADEIVKALQRTGQEQSLQGADLVLSDMAPNMSGVASADQARAIGLCELALHMAVEVMNDHGVFVVKVFQGEGYESFLREVRGHFRQVRTRKPAASRPRSRETYLVARNLIR